MKMVNIEAAGLDLSRLVDAAAAGEEIVFARGGQPVARLEAIATEQGLLKRGLGRLRGKISVPPDFDAPLPDETIALFNGR